MANVQDPGGPAAAVERSALALAVQSPARIFAFFRGALSRNKKPAAAPGTEVAVAERRLPPGFPVEPDDPEGPDAVKSWAGRAMLSTFVGIVLAPTFLSTLYFGLWASDSYVSETLLAVRAASDQKQQLQGALELFSKVFPGPKTSGQDSQIVLEYARSKPIIEDIGGISYVESLFSKSNIDYFARLEPGLHLESVWKYWKSHVQPTLDTRAGIVAIKVYAYTPEDAHALASKIVEASERLVNSVSQRSRADSVAQSRREVENSQEKLILGRTALVEYRNRNVTIDPLRKAEDIGKVIVDLTMQRLQLQNQMASFGDALNANSPSVRNNRNRIEELDKQIAEFQQRLTTLDIGVSSISGELAEYERLKLNEQFAEKFYQMTLLSYERALQDSRRQQLYLSTVVRPTMPEKAMYPERTINIALTFLCFFVIWGLGCMFTATIMDHMS